MRNIFLCPECRSGLEWIECSVCGYRVHQKNSIYQFCDDPAVKLEGENKYIGYDGIGEDFDPETIYWDTGNIERYGVYEACSDLVARNFGNDITVLDLGAGLGAASIPLAKNGLFTIAADISNVMLSGAVRRAKGRFDNLFFARMNAYQLMLADNSVDIVVVNAMLHLIENPEGVLKEIVRVLKPGGQLVCYGSYPQPLTDEEGKKNTLCNSVLEDISNRFYEKLVELGYESLRFDNNAYELISKYFELPYREIADGFSEVFTEKLKFRLHRLKTGAHSDLQKTPKEWIELAWDAADKYARAKYGDDYISIKGFSRYGAEINVYRVGQ